MWKSELRSSPGSCCRHMLCAVLCHHHAQHQPAQPQRARQAHCRALHHHEPWYQRGRGPSRGAAEGESTGAAPAVCLPQVHKYLTNATLEKGLSNLRIGPVRLRTIHPTVGKSGQELEAPSHEPRSTGVRECLATQRVAPATRRLALPSSPHRPA